MKVLITGMTGMTGSHLAEYLLMLRDSDEKPAGDLKFHSLNHFLIFWNIGGPGSAAVLTTGMRQKKQKPLYANVNETEQ